MAQEYEDNNFLPPQEFRDDCRPTPALRTKKMVKRPILAPRTKFNQTAKALKGFTKNYEINS